MLKNYLTIAFRNLWRQKGHTALNVAGLAIGMGVFLLIFQWVRHETSFDRFHEKADRIYGVVSARHQHDETSHSRFVPNPYAPVLDRIPAIEERVTYVPTLISLVSVGERTFFEEDVAYASENFFRVFDFDLQRGDRRTALVDPFSVVLTKEMAAKYFGGDDPVGQIITIDDYDHTVTGILAPIPTNSHLRFSSLRSHASYSVTHRLAQQAWIAGARAFLLLSPNQDVAAVEAQMAELLAEVRPHNFDPTYEFALQRLTDVYLRSEHISGAVGGNVATLFVFWTIGLILLLVACINYMNLATARSITRAREVGIRSVVGARRSQLAIQFLGESTLMALLALPAALALATVLGRVVGDTAGLQLAGTPWNDASTLLVLGAMLLAVGVVAGCYPALVISGQRPAESLKGQVRGSRTNAALRKGLVGLQMVATVSLIGCTIVVYLQLAYVTGRDLGYEREGVVAIQSPSGGQPIGTYQAFNEDLTQYDAVRGVTAASPGRPFGWTLPSTRIISFGGEQIEPIQTRFILVDYGFLDALGISLVEGRDFSPEYGTDGFSAFILNETAVRLLGGESAVGRRLQLERDNRGGTVVGVVRDFHYYSLREPIEPLVFMLLHNYPLVPPAMYVRLSPDDLSGAFDLVKTKWTEHFGDRPMLYWFVDDFVTEHYVSDAGLARVLGFFALVTVFVACLGLFGLAAYAARTRTKEIGIRKVLGATVSSIVGLLSKDFAKLVALATVVAAPIAYLAASRWLEDFAYRIEISWWIFVLSGGIALAIALLTVSSQAVKAALTNPAEALRTE